MKIINAICSNFLPAWIIILLITVSCTKYDNPGGDFEEYEESIDTTIHRKVLWINIEGAVGEEVKKVMPPTIESLLSHSKYTWTGLSENSTSDATTWASLVTGLNMDKHRIVDETFIPSTSLNNTQNNLPFFPSVFYNINEVNPAMKTLTVSSWNPLADVLFAHADTKVDVSSDEEVRDAMIEQLENSDPDLALATFRNVLEAGKEEGFSAENTGYVEAINRTDGYINDILEAMRSRENFSRENWLVIITSNHGGKENNYGGSSAEERNTFNIFYHPDYSSQEMGGKRILTTRFDQNLKAVVDDQGTYSHFNNPEMTVEFFMRLNPDEDGDYTFNNWDKILGKNRWGIYRKQSNTRIYMEGDGWTIEEPINNSFIDGKWHHMAVSMAINRSANMQVVKMYYDGAQVLSKEFPDAVDFYEDSWSVNGELTIGGTYVYFNLADLRIWDTALSAFQIAENACLLEIEPTHREYEHLIGYWPMQEEASVLVNEIVDRPAVEMVNDTTYFSSSPNNLPCDFGANSINVENTTIVPQVYYWLGLSINSDWNLDREPFLDRFELEVENF